MSNPSSILLLLLVSIGPVAPWLFYSLSTAVLSVRRRRQEVRAIGLDVDVSVMSAIVSLLLAAVLCFLGRWPWVFVLVILPLATWRMVFVRAESLVDVRLFLFIPWRFRRIRLIAHFVDEGWGDEADPSTLAVGGPEGLSLRLATALSKADVEWLEGIRGRANTELADIRRSAGTSAT